MLELSNVFNKMDPLRYCPIGPITRSNYLNYNAYLFEKNMKQTMDSKDELYLWNLFAKMNRESRHYLNLFGLCILLGAIHIYDIGCGFNMQLGYLLHYNGISYTGIEREAGDSVTIVRKRNGVPYAKEIKTDEFDYEKWNENFRMWNPQFQIIHREYPFSIQCPPNNIAIAVGYHSFTDTFTAAKTLTEDFERFIVQVDSTTLPIWKANFNKIYTKEIYRYAPTTESEQIYIFGTKFEDDVQYLESMGYNYHDDRFFINSITETDRYLAKYYLAVNYDMKIQDIINQNNK